jgi:hypothetical protein
MHTHTCSSLSLSSFLPVLFLLNVLIDMFYEVCRRITVLWDVTLMYTCKVDELSTLKVKGASSSEALISVK